IGWDASRDGTPICSSCGSLACDRRLEGRSRMRREFHVRFCEGGRVRFPSATRRLVHCRNEQEAQTLKAELQARLAECRLELHPAKTKIVYCKDRNRTGAYPNVQFDFLGYCFRPRMVRRSRDNKLFCGFNPAVSSSALKAMRTTIRELDFRHLTQLSLVDIARRVNPLLRGWIEYFGRYAPSALYPLLRYVNQML